VNAFQSTRPVRGATSGRVARHRQEGVSIHAPREGRDLHGGRNFHRNKGGVSIHAPREGRDFLTAMAFTKLMMFQSTRPVRGATYKRLVFVRRDFGFNPRAP